MKLQQSSKDRACAWTRAACATIALAVLAVPACAQSAPPPGRACPDPVSASILCLPVASHMRDKDKRNDYLYQTILYGAACVDPHRDSPQLMAARIREVWRLAENKLVCNSSRFDVSDGNILKFAVSNKFDAFIDDAIAWGVNLNRIDPGDGATVLDYTARHIRKNKGKALEEQFQIYYDQLREAGAKHCHELLGKDPGPDFGCR